MSRDIALVRVVCTCDCVPAQWDAWDANGQYYYLRYRFGRGTVDTYDTPDSTSWLAAPEGDVAAFCDADDPWRGDIELDEFLQRTGLQLAPGAVVVSYDEYVALAHQTADDLRRLRQGIDSKEQP